jgi:HAD superfamily hydrolase (TIGR01509 family)
LESREAANEVVIVQCGLMRETVGGWMIATTSLGALHMPCPGLVIFDCDGVLVDSEHIAARVWSECFQAEGFAVTAEDLRNNLGISGAGLAEMIKARFGRPIPDGFMNATRAKIMEVFTEELRAIDGAAELLRSISVPVCVASNSHTDRVRHSLKVTELWRFFDPHVFSVTMVERGKPAPDLFLFAAQKFGIPPGECLVVEDSVHGITAALAAGTEVVGFCGGSHCRPDHAERLLSAGCTRVFARMVELSEFLRSLDGS